MRARADGPRGHGVLGTLYLYEIRMLLRDTRTILIAVIAPLVLFPVLLLVSIAVERRDERRIEEATYLYAVTGPEAGLARTLVDRAVALTMADAAAVPADTDSAAGGGTFSSDSFVERRVANPDSLLRAGEIHLVVEGLGPDAYRETLERERHTGAAEEAAAADEDPPRVPVLRIHYRSDRDLSRTAMERLQDRLGEVRAQHRDSVYRAHGLPVDPGRVGLLESENVATAEREGGAFLGLILTPLLLFLMLSGGSIVAADAISGEKERGTLETLLTTAARRSEIVGAKQLAVITVGVAVTVINLLNLLVYLVLGWIDLPSNLAVPLPPLSLVVLLALFLPVTVLVSSALLLLSGYAKSYKEYQMYFFPLFLAFLVPALAGMLPGMDLRSAVALLPVAGVGVAVREVMIGELDWPFLGVAFASTGVAAWGAARLTARTLSTERLISAAELDEADLRGGPALFPKRVLRWFGVLWVLLFVTSLWMGEGLGLEGQVLFNVVGLFFVGSLLMVRQYRLDAREAFSLRAPHPAVWAAVLVGAPAALVTGLGVAELFQLFAPVPERVMRSFGEFLVTDTMPLWRLVLFLAVIPGVFEELAFRGVLLHGLSRRLRPVPLALVVGLVFGIFHISLWRIPPTAYLGIVLATVVLLTGSIYPAMLWHALNNAAALVPARLGWVEDDFTLPGWSYPVAAVALMAAFRVLWVTRPRPGIAPPPAEGRAPVPEP